MAIIMSTATNTKHCEWKNCDREGRYRIQTSANKDDIHWFCQTHARTFDLSVVNQGPFIGSAGPNWTQKQNKSSGSSFNEFKKPAPGVNPDIRMRHVSGQTALNYTRKDLSHLKILGLDTGATPDEIKKAYKTLVKHCHPDQNPDLENGTYIFNKISEAYNALKDKDFK